MDSTGVTHIRWSLEINNMGSMACISEFNYSCDFRYDKFIIAILEAGRTRLTCDLMTWTENYRYLSFKANEM